MSSKYKNLTDDIFLIESRIEELSNERNNCGNMIFVMDNMLKNQILFLLIGIGLSFFCGGFCNISNFFASALSMGLYGSLTTLIVVLVSTAFFAIGKVIYTKKFKKLETDILLSEDLKYECEKELLKIRKKEMTVVDSKNNTISFSESDSLVVEAILGKENNQNDKPKKRTLKKKK